MKKLYNRNKDIEVYHKQKQVITSKENPDQNKEETHELDIIAEFKKREEEMTQELIDKQQQID
jgi:hypothetical protein